MGYFRLIDDIEIPRRRHLGEISCGPRRLVNFLDGVPVDIGEVPSVEVTHFGRPLEFCLTGFGVPVETTALCAVVSPIADGDVEVVPVEVAGQAGFAVLNCVKLVSCIDEARSEFTKWTSTDYRADLAGQYRSVTRLVLNGHKVPPHANLFRVEGWQVALIASEHLKDAMSKHGCFGAKFVPLPTSQGLRP